MDIIHLLPDSVANQIAAGEVIQRPASCLKELVENSLDAGASRIQIVVRDAGRALLQVIDNGCGMSATDVRMAFERHATSKINTAQDLFALRTMGFRGEALASICAVAQVEVQTRRNEDEVGSLLEIAGSNVVRQESCSCPVGTSIKVKNLFFNIPVRRKFLKTDQTELRNLLVEFYHIVLVYPKVQFTFVHNDEVLIELPIGTEKQRIEAIFGKGGNKSYTGNFVDVNSDTEIISIRGFVGKPETAGKNAQQYFFVNGRYMRHPYFHKAIMTAYSGMLPGDNAPSYFLYFDIEPDRIDVNIHPTKTEIKFQDEQTIFQLILASVRESLGKFNIAPTLDFNRDGEVEMPTSSSSDIKVPHVVIDPNYNPFQPSSTYSHVVDSSTKWQPLSVQAKMDELFADNQDDIQPYTYGGKYLISPSRNGLYVIHQRRAHTLVLFEQYRQQINQRKNISQQLLFPETLELTVDEMAFMETLLDDFRYLGFELEQFGKTCYNIVGIPPQLTNESAVPVLKGMLQCALEGRTQQEWQDRIAWSLAEATAIPYGKKLIEEEARDLINRLFCLPSYRVTPNGKTIVFEWTEEEISKHF